MSDKLHQRELALRKVEMICHEEKPEIFATLISKEKSWKFELFIAKHQYRCCINNCQRVIDAGEIVNFVKLDLESIDEKIYFNCMCVSCFMFYKAMLIDNKLITRMYKLYQMQKG